MNPVRTIADPAPCFLSPPPARLAWVVGLGLSVGCAVSTSHARPPPPRAVGLTQLSDDFERLAARVEPAVVQIFATGYAPIAGPSGPTLSVRQASGSGVFLNSDGLILTNAHVVQGAKKLTVSLARSGAPAGRSVVKPKGSRVAAVIVGVDPETDLALIDIEGRGYKYLELGDSEALSPGEIVLAFGSPRGLDGSVSMGVVSAVARQLSADDPMVYIQTDAPINPGNSGGPMVNTRGEVVGINTLILSQSGGSEGLGFAVPSHIARTVVEHLRARGRVRRGIIGVETQTIDSVLAEGLGLPRSWGVILSDVYPGSPAEKAGLKVGDLVLTLNAKAMENARQFDVNVYHQPLGRSVDLEIWRRGEELRYAVVVVERPDSMLSGNVSFDPVKNRVERLGILAVEVEALPRPLQAAMRNPSGVAVISGAPGDAARAGLQPADVIHALNQRSVSDLDTLNGYLEMLEDGDAVVLTIERNSRLRFLSFLIE